MFRVMDGRTNAEAAMTALPLWGVCGYPFLSLDPSTTSTGWCHWEQERPVAWGVWKPTRHPELWERIRVIAGAYAEWLAINPDVQHVAVEDPQFYATQRSTQRQGSLMVGALAGATPAQIQWHPYHQQTIKATSRPEGGKAVRTKSEAHEALGWLSEEECWGVPENLNGDIKDAVLVGWHHIQGVRQAATTLHEISLLPNEINNGI